MNVDLLKYSDACPAFIFPLVMKLRMPHPDMSADDVRDAIHRIALSIPDVTRLRHLIDPEGTGAYDEFYPLPATEPRVSTLDAIGTFLSTYGHDDPAETELINRMIFNPVPADYALTLEEENPATPESTAAASANEALIDNFINTHSEPATRQSAGPAHEPPVSPEQPAADPVPAGSLLSQSLAKIFIKQGNYRQAYEIIRSLSLKYPEKSIYFADQLRFLRKLIIVQDANRKKDNRQHKKTTTK